MAIGHVTREAGRLFDADVIGRQRWMDGLSDQFQHLLSAAVERGGPSGQRVKDFLHGTWLGHPLHPALTDLPLGAGWTGTVMDLMGAQRAADIAMLLGVVTALPTAAAGAADWKETSGSQRRVGIVHAMLNTVGLGCYVCSVLARRAERRALGVGLSTMGLGIVFVSAYLGSDLVFRQGTGVSRDAWLPEDEQFHVAARYADLVEGKLASGEITVNGERVPLVLLRHGDEVLALSGICVHAGGPLAAGRLVSDECVECPWHGSVFNMRDGSVVHGPAATPAPAYQVRVRAGNVEVRLAHA
ncbi:MAG: Rieske 2Fe-2S domain-containing protein [Chloroflexi bacterium]|nr:Rieske 2Fe-2S domain-containing protein [Chloroflexota bacterium]